MQRLSTRLVVTFSALLVYAASSLFSQGYERKESPFDDARFVGPDGSRIEVEVDGTWYEPLAIDGTPVVEILAFCASQWPEMDRRRRFLQDLVEALKRMGREPGPTVRLEVRTLGPGPVREIELEDVILTREKRQKFVDTPRWRNAFLTAAQRQRLERAQRAKSYLSRQAALADLELFRIGLEERFAYLHWKGIDLEAQVEALAKRVPDSERGVPVDWLRDRLEELLLRFGDGHSRVEAARPPIPRGGFPPYLLVAAADGVAAIWPDRSALLDPERPYVVEIDGEPLSTWLDRARSQIADGSPQFVLEGSLRQLLLLDRLRARDGLRTRTDVTLGLGASVTKVDRRLDLQLTKRPPSYGSWPRGETRTLEGNVGYLRIPRMSPETEPIHDAMASFRKTRGMIVDVRGNRGGTRNALVAFAAYLQAPDEPPWIGNVATYKRALDRDDDHLENRFLFHRSDPRWSQAQRAAIDAFQGGFEPEWKPEDHVGARFSEWHYLVLGRTGDEREYFYDRPVIVLSDASSFSATDVFLGALRGRPRVTLLCQDSGGGSARSQSFELPHSGLRVTAASMASFQPNGLLYDGRGVKVDVEVPQPPTDFLLGGTDHCLDEALRRLQ